MGIEYWKRNSLESKEVIQDLSHSMTEPTKWPLRPAKTQVSLGVHLIWLESLLPAWRNLGPLAILRAHNDDSDQTVQMPRLIWVFAVCTGHFVGLIMLWLLCYIESVHTSDSWNQASVCFFQGIEDYMGDMDFKIAGSRTGFTALQVQHLDRVKRIWYL